jgi:hypothetical protein
MGNSGMRKMLFPGDLVETPYNSIYDIDFMDMNRQMQKLENGKVSLIVNVSSKNSQSENQIK